jgi:hypothetical protein
MRFAALAVFCGDDNLTIMYEGPTHPGQFTFAHARDPRSFTEIACAVIVQLR